MKNKTVRDLTHIAIVAALYVVLTIVPPFNLISYGPYQFRIAEMFNLLDFIIASISLLLLWDV